jgi:hypothetical protein
MGLGKMLAGIFKKDEVDAVQAGRSNSGDGPAEGVEKEHIIQPGLSAVLGESAGLHGEAGMSTHTKPRGRKRGESRCRVRPTRRSRRIRSSRSWAMFTIPRYRSI